MQWRILFALTRRLCEKNSFFEIESCHGLVVSVGKVSNAEVEPLCANLKDDQMEAWADGFGGSGWIRLPVWESRITAIVLQAGRESGWEEP